VAGAEPVEIVSPEPLPLKSWTLVKLDRDGGNALLLIDGNPVAEGSANVDDDDLLTAAAADLTGLFVGGLPPSVAGDDARAGYVGCLADLKVEPDHVDLTKGSTILEAANVVAGCAEAAAPQNSLSFAASGGASGGSFVQMPRLATNGSISFSLMFRTTASQVVMSTCISFLRPNNLFLWIPVSKRTFFFIHNCYWKQTWKQTF
jgi:hypothetical protein